VTKQRAHQLAEEKGLPRSCLAKTPAAECEPVRGPGVGEALAEGEALALAAPLRYKRRITFKHVHEAFGL
jgi:hypothetical protein